MITSYKVKLVKFFPIMNCRLILEYSVRVCWGFNDYLRAVFRSTQVMFKSMNINMVGKRMLKTKYFFTNVTIFINPIQSEYEFKHGRPKNVEN